MVAHSSVVFPYAIAGSELVFTCCRGYKAEDPL